MLLGSAGLWEADGTGLCGGAILPVLVVPGHRYSRAGAVALGEWAEPMLETVGKPCLCRLPGSNESPHACHDCTGLGKPLAGLPGLGCAGGGGLSPRHSSPPVPFPHRWGTVGDAGVSGELGGCCGGSAVFATPPALSRHGSIPQRRGGGREEPVSLLFPALPSVLSVIFDLLSCCPCSSLPSCFLTVVAGLFPP